MILADGDRPARYRELIKNEQFYLASLSVPQQFALFGNSEAVEMTLAEFAEFANKKRRESGLPPVGPRKA